MVNHNYRKGYAWELVCKRQLEGRGFRVYRTAGSHTETDLIAINPSSPLIKEAVEKSALIFTQCKVRRNARGGEKTYIFPLYPYQIVFVVKPSKTYMNHRQPVVASAKTEKEEVSGLSHPKDVTVV
jgi:hypothetical protein